MWERVFADESGGRPPSKSRDTHPIDPTPIDAVWLVSRIHKVPVDVGRRRLETFLFAQRVFPTLDSPDPLVSNALAAYGAFPSLLVTLERAGVTSAATMHAAVVRAAAISDIGDDQARTLTLQQFQASLGILDRIVRAGSLSKSDADGLVSRLAAIEYSKGSYAPRLAAWIQKDLLAKLPVVHERLARRAGGHAACGDGGRSRTKHPIVKSSGRAAGIASARRAAEATAPAPRPTSAGRPIVTGGPRARAVSKGRRRRARAGRHVDVHPLRGVPGRSAGPGGCRRQRRAAPRSWRDRRHGAARGVAAADRGAHEQGLARHGLAPRTRRGAGAPGVAASRR